MRPESALALAVVLTAVGGTNTARAVPNRLCGGVCEDGATACGRARDCAEGACEFPDACLPGFAALIEEVLPDAPGGVDDAFAWTCGSVACRVSDDGTVHFASQAGIGAAAVKDLVFQPGRRFLVRADMRADADTWGFVDIVGATVSARSADIAGPAEWAPVMLLIDVPDAAMPEPLQLRVHAAGPGEIGWKNAVVYVLGDYGVYLRWTLVEPARDAGFRVASILRQAGNPPGFRPRICGADEGASDDCVAARLTYASADAGAASGWLEVSAMFSGGLRATLSWEVVDPVTAQPIDARRVLAEVAWRPEAGAVIWSSDIAPSSGRMALTLPEGVPRPDLMASYVTWVRDLVAADRQAFAPAAARPSTLAVGTTLASIDAFDDHATVAADAIGLLADLGANVATFMTASPTDEERVAAKQAGLTHQWLRADGLLSPWDQPTSGRDFDLDALRLDVSRNLTNSYWSDAARHAEDPDEILAITASAPSGLAFGGPKYRAAFHAWLGEGAVRAGLTPADFGVQSFDAVPPLEDMAPSRVAELRPSPTEPTMARRFVWALRFWSVASARAFAAALDTWLTMSRVPWQAAWNAGTPLAGRDYQWTLGVEAQTMLANGAGTALLGDGSLGDLDDCRPWELGYYGDWVRGVVEPFRRGDGMPIATHLHAQRGDQGRKMIELAARGFTWFNHASYGPNALTVGDGAGGLGAASQPWLDRVARGSELLARAEPALLGTRRGAAPIVMLGSQSDAVWTDLPGATADELGWHMALSQAHYPIDILPESEIEAGALEGPGPTRRVLFVLRKHLSQAAFEAIRRWVEAGGTLVLGPDLANYDEYAQLDPARSEWLAVAPGPIEPAGKRQLVRWVTREGLTSFSFDGPWTELVGVGGTTVAVAENADDPDSGRPIALRVPRGRGRVFALGLALGAAFRAPVAQCGARPAVLATEYPDGSSDAMRDAMTSIPEILELDRVRPVWADDARVSLQALDGPTGPVVVAVAWAGQPLNVALSSNEWRGCASVHETIEDYELPVLFGNVLLRVDRAAVLTWDPVTCRSVGGDAGDADDARAEDVPGAKDDDGCQGADLPAAAWWAGLALVIGWLGRRAAARS